MAGPRGVPVMLDRERHLRYPMAAIEAIEERFDVDLVRGDAFEPDSLKDIVWLIYLGLRHESPAPRVMWWHRLLVWLGVREPVITPERVAEWLDLRSMSDAVAAMNEAMGGERISDVSADASQEKKATRALPV